MFVFFLRLSTKSAMHRRYQFLSIWNPSSSHCKINGCPKMRKKPDLKRFFSFHWIFAFFFFFFFFFLMAGIKHGEVFTLRRGIKWGKRLSEGVWVSNSWGWFLARDRTSCRGRKYDAIFFLFSFLWFTQKKVKYATTQQRVMMIQQWDVVNKQEEWLAKKICKKFKFDHTNKWYMHNPAPVLENYTHKLLWDFNIQIPARRPDLVIINNKKREFAKLSTLLSRRTTE